VQKATKLTIAYQLSLYKPKRGVHIIALAIDTCPSILIFCLTQSNFCW